MITKEIRGNADWGWRGIVRMFVDDLEFMRYVKPDGALREGITYFHSYKQVEQLSGNCPDTLELTHDEEDLTR